MNQNFRYFTTASHVTCTFAKTPKSLIYSEFCQSLSGDARFLYVAMLDRLSLSIKNEWSDDNGRIYIVMSNREITQIMNCSPNKATRLLTELDSFNGQGLISRKRRGLGKPDMIYINAEFFDTKEETKIPTEEEMSTTDSEPTDKMTSQNIPPCRESEHTPDNPTDKNEYNYQETAESEHKRDCSINNAYSAIVKMKNPESSFWRTNNNKYNKNKINNNNINHISHMKHNVTYDDYEDKQKMIDGWIEERKEYKEIIEDGIGYSALLERCDKKVIDNMVSVMVNTLCDEAPTVRIGKREVPYSAVKRRLYSLNDRHIEFVYDNIMKNSRPVNNANAYLITAIYNSADTAYVF